MPAAVVVVQHGEKEPTAGDPGLTARGVEQVEVVVGVLAAATPRPVAVSSSPLRRAVETAAPIAAALGVPAVVDPRLRERMNWEGVHVQSRDDFLAEWTACSRDRDFVPTCGDSSHAAARRFLAAIDELVDVYPDQTVVVVSHGGVTTDVLRTLLGDDRVVTLAPALIAEGVPSCALTWLVHDGSGWRVDSVASTAHLGHVV